MSNKNELIELLSTNKSQELYQEADQVRKKYMGNGIFLRGIVEFSSYCDNQCKYCGLNKNNQGLRRYRLTKEEILKSVDLIASSKIKTVVLQSGEEHDLDPEWLADVIRAIKAKHDMSITISAGEKPKDIYKLWKEAGADRYLLKIETTDEKLYQKLHPDMTLQNRMRCSENLKELGYQNGSGLLIGLPGQTIESIAEDILWLNKYDFDMIGIGLFIPHKATELADIPRGNLELTLKTLAVTRIVTKNTHLPATTAIGSLEQDYRIDALKAGANVIMPNFTPQPYKQLYEIYPDKKCITEKQGACAKCMEVLANSIGRYIDYSKGNSLKG